MRIARCSAWWRRICAATGCARPDGEGLPAEAVLRCALLKQHRQLSYEELAFHLEDFGVVSGLCPAAAGRGPRRSRCCRRRSARSGPRPGRRSIGRCLPSARQDKLEERRDGAAGQHRHRGADARAERQQPVVGRGAGDGRGCCGRRMPCRRHRRARWRDHRRAAKKRARAIQYTRGRPKRRPALPRADRDHPRDLGLSAAARRRELAAAHRPGASSSGRPRSATICR